MSDLGANFLARVGVEVDPKGVKEFEKLVIRSFENIAAEARRRQSSGESLAGISGQFQQLQTTTAEVAGALPGDVRTKLLTSTRKAQEAAAEAIGKVYEQAGAAGRFSPLSAATTAAITRQSATTQQEVARQQRGSDRARQQAEAAAATAAARAAADLETASPANQAINKEVLAYLYEELAGSKAYLDATARLSLARDRLAAAETIAANNPENVGAAANAELAKRRLAAAEKAAVLGGTTGQDVTNAATNELNEARLRVAQQLLVEQRTLVEDNVRLGELAAARARNATVQGLAQISATTPADLAGRAQLDAERQLAAAQATIDQIAAAKQLAGNEEAYTEVLGRARAAKDEETAATRRATAETLAQSPSFVADTAATNALREATNQRVKLAELGLPEIAGENAAHTEARIAVERQARANQQRLAEIQSLRTSEGRDAALIVERQLAEKQLTREYNARVQQEIRTRIESGDIEKGTLFQQIQASIAGRQGGTPRLPTDFPTGGQTLASRFSTTAGFALSGLGTFAAISSLKEIYTSEQQVQQSFVAIQGQLNALGQSSSLGVLKSQIAGIAADTGTAEAGIAAVFPQIKGAFADSKVALADARTAAEFAKITRADLQATVASLVPASIAFGVSFREITDSALGIQERAGVTAQRTVDLYGALGPVAVSAGLSLKQVGAIAAAVLQDTARTPQSVAEDFNRLIPQLQQKSANIANILQQSGASNANEFVADITSGKVGNAIQLLIEDYSKLAPAQQQALEAATGSGRGAKDIIDLLLNQKVAAAELAPALNDAGKTTKYFSDLQKTLGQQLSEIREQLLQFGRALLESGVASAFQDILTIVSLVLRGVKDLAELFVLLNSVSGGAASRLLEVVAAAKALQLVLRLLQSDAVRGTFEAIVARIPGLGGRGGAGPTAATETTAATEAAAAITGAGTEFATTVVTAAEEAAAALRGGGVAAAAEMEAGGAAAGAEGAAGSGVGAVVVGAGAGAVGGELAGAGTEGAVAGFLNPLFLIPAGLIVAGLAVKSAGDKFSKEAKKYADTLGGVSDADLASQAGKSPSEAERLKRFFFDTPTHADQSAAEARKRAANQSGILGLADAAAAAKLDIRGVDFAGLGASGDAPFAEAEKQQQFIQDLSKQGGKGLPDVIKAVKAGDQGALAVLERYVTALKITAGVDPAVQAAISQAQVAIAEAKDPKTNQSTSDQLIQSSQDAIDAFASGESSLADSLQQLHLNLTLAVGAAKDKIQAKLDKVVSDALLQDQQLADSLQNGSSADDAGKVGREVALFNLPQFNDPAARVTLAKQIVQDLKAQLTAEADMATNTADRNRILAAGLQIPDSVRQVLAQQLVDNDPLIQAYFAAVGSIDQGVMKQIERDTVALVTGGKALGTAVATALQAQLDKLESFFTESFVGPGGDFGAIADEINSIQAQLNSALSNLTGLDAIGGVSTTVTNAPTAGTGASAAQTAEQLRQAQAALDTANAGKDPVRVAEIARDLAQANLDAANAAGDEVKALEARGALAQAERQLQDAYASIGQAQDNLDAARRSLDPVAAAEDALRLANDQLAAAQQANDTVGVINAQIAQINASRAQQKALQDLGISRLELVKAELTASQDLVGAAKEQVTIIQTEISDALARGVAPGSAELNGLYAQLSTATRDVTTSQISDTEQQIQNDLDLKRITIGDAVAKLRALEALQASQKDRDEIEKRVRSLLQQQDLSFNIPTGIQLPTLYQVNRTQQAGGLTQYDNRIINVQLAINNGMDQQQVTQYLSDLFGLNSRVLATGTRRT